VLNGPQRKEVAADWRNFCTKWLHGFDPGSVHVGFVVDKVALGQVFLLVLRSSPVNFIPLVLH
jgi:hypothetical protein